MPEQLKPGTRGVNNMTKPIKHQELSDQRLSFVSQLFNPKVMFNAALAYKKAYPNCKSGWNAHAARLIAKDSIKQEIAKRRAKMVKKTGFTTERAQDMYEDAYDLASVCKQPSAMVSAVTGIARLYGMERGNDGGEKTIIVISPQLPDSTVKRKLIDSKEIENE